MQGRLLDFKKNNPLPNTIDAKIINDFNSNIIVEEKKDLYNTVVYFIYHFLENNINMNVENKKSYDTEYIIFEDFIKLSQTKNNYKILKHKIKDDKLDFSYFLLNNI